MSTNANTNNPQDVNIDAAYLRDSMIHLSLMKGLFYNNNIYDNGALNTLQDGQHLQVDSLVTTSYGKLYPEDAANFFEGSTRVNKSNGAIFVTDSLRLHTWSFWNPPITVEAENSSSIASITGGNRTVYAISSGKQNPNIEGSVSNRSYLQVSPSTASGNPSINLYLPDVLSTKYRIYGVFVPANITNFYATDTLPSSIRAQLIYNNEFGAIPRAALTLGNFETNPNKIDTVAIGEFEFPIAYAGTGNYAPILRLSGVVQSSERDKYTRTIRLDCILLIPVELDDYMKEHPDYTYPKTTETYIYY